MRILILKPSSLGDVVQALPVLRLLKLHLPESEIYWWIDSHLSPLLENDPDLAGIFLFERRRWSSPFHWDKLFASVRAARARKFDWVIDLQSLLRSGLFAWMANGDLTVGLEDRREGAAAFYDIAVARPSFHTHAVDWYLSVLPALGVPVHWRFTWLPPCERVAAGLKAKWSLDSARRIVIQPGARWENKRWPVGHFADLVRRLAAENSELEFVILGGTDALELGRTIAATAPGRCRDLTGRASLPEMVEWIRGSELMITNDTGPMHVAAALGKPVVALFGPTEPRRTGPYGQNGRVLQLTTLPCVPCLKDTCEYEKEFECLRAITPATVCLEVRRLLAGR